MKILFLSAWYPYPPDNGSKLRIYNLLRLLARRHEVTLVTLADQPLPAQPPELRALCQAVYVVSRRPYNPTSARALCGLFGVTPRSIVDTYVPAMAERIRYEVASAQYDLVVASQWEAAAYAPAFDGLPAILEELELGVLEAKKTVASTPLRRLRHDLTLLKLRFYLRRLLPRFAACTVVSVQEATLLRRLVPGYQSLEVIPNCIDLGNYARTDSAPEPDTLIFTGSFRYFANHDAMRWFLGEVYPRIRSRVPGVQLTITGDHANLPLPRAAGVTLTGFVEDVRPLIASSWVSLAPIRVGGGTRLKILEAMALRTPVVATSKGAEGLEVRHGEHLLIADTPDAFADAVISVLTDAHLGEQLAESAHRLIREKHDWGVVGPRFLALTERAACSAATPWPATVRGCPR